MLLTLDLEAMTPTPALLALLVGLATSDPLPTPRQAEAYGKCRRREALLAGATPEQAAIAAPPGFDDNYVVWTVTDGIALGNSLNVFMNAFLMALCVARVIAPPRARLTPAAISPPATRVGGSSSGPA